MDFLYEFDSYRLHEEHVELSREGIISGELVF